MGHLGSILRWRGRGFFDYFQEHSAFVLVEPFCSFVYVVVCSGIGTTYDHYCYIFIVNAIVIDWWFEEVRVLFQPFGEV